MDLEELGAAGPLKLQRKSRIAQDGKDGSHLSSACFILTLIMTYPSRNFDASMVVVDTALLHLTSPYYLLITFSKSAFTSRTISRSAVVVKE